MTAMLSAGGFTGNGLFFPAALVTRFFFEAFTAFPFDAPFPVLAVVFFFGLPEKDFLNFFATLLAALFTAFFALPAAFLSIFDSTFPMASVSSRSTFFFSPVFMRVV